MQLDINLTCISVYFKPLGNLKVKTIYIQTQDWSIQGRGAPPCGDVQRYLSFDPSINFFHKKCSLKEGDTRQLVECLNKKIRKKRNTLLGDTSLGTGNGLRYFRCQVKS